MKYNFKWMLLIDTYLEGHAVYHGMQKSLNNALDCHQVSHQVFDNDFVILSFFLMRTKQRVNLPSHFIKQVFPVS